MKRKTTTMPGLRAPAFLLAAMLVAAVPVVTPATFAQTAQPPVSSQPVPNDLELAKLLWTTIAAIDHANQSGNYSVLRDISAPGFQILNDPARLAEVFASIRASRIDLSNCLLLAPTYTAAPTIVDQGVMRVQGNFGLRPTAIFFDMYFQWIQGKWRLYGVSILPQTIASVQPTAPEQRRRGN